MLEPAERKGEGGLCEGGGKRWQGGGGVRGGGEEGGGRVRGEEGRENREGR